MESKKQRVYNKLHLSEAISGAILHKEYKNLEKKCDELIKKNAALWGSTELQCFYHQGLFFQSHTISGLKAGNPHPSLMGELNEHIQYRNNLKTDRHAIRQLLGLILLPCSSELQDLRDALPDSIVTLAFKNIPERTRPALYTIQDNERAMRAYERIMPRIEYYIGMQLLY